jgi:hypothetical protein
VKTEIFLDPESYPRDVAFQVNPVPASLAGKRVGLLFNAKSGGNLILQCLGEHLVEWHPGVELVRHDKEHASLALTDEGHALMGECDLVLTAVGDCGSCSSWTIHDSVAMEKAGIPVVAVCTKPFEQFAHAQAASLGVPDLRVLILEHPVAELDLDAIRGRVAAELDQLDGLLTATDEAAASTGEVQTGVVTTTEVLDLGEDEALELFEQRGMVDGFPLVVPTVDRVEEMLGNSVAEPNLVIGRVGPRYGLASARNVAVAAVAAGCRPEYFPVVLAAVRAALKPAFNLSAIQATTHPVSILTLVSGPITERIGMNAGTNAFGQGNRANATIGRAVRLAVLALGGAWPGNGDMATHGTPAKFSFAAAENLAQSPWASLASTMGHAEGESVAMVVGGEGPQNVNDHESSTGLGIMRTIAGTMRSTGANQHYYRHGQAVVVIGPEHASTIAGDGYSREDVQRFLWEEARMPLSFFSEENLRKRVQRIYPEKYGQYGAHTTMPAVAKQENILVTVVGGVGKHSVYIPTFGATKASTETIRDADGPL